jgi:hypothetical protein
VLLPSQSDHGFIHQVIYEQLIYGRIPADAADRFAAYSKRMTRTGADEVLLGYAELEMQATDWFPALILNSTGVHAEGGLEYHGWTFVIRSLGRLHQKGYISHPATKAKSVLLTDEGAKRSQELFEKHLTK